MEPVIRLHPQDDVVIARHQLISGTKLASENVTIRGLVPPGHKVATKKIPTRHTSPIHKRTILSMVPIFFFIHLLYPIFKSA